LSNHGETQEALTALTRTNMKVYFPSRETVIKSTGGPDVCCYLELLNINSSVHRWPNFFRVPGLSASRRNGGRTVSSPENSSTTASLSGRAC